MQSPDIDKRQIEIERLLHQITGIVVQTKGSYSNDYSLIAQLVLNNKFNQQLLGKLKLKHLIKEDPGPEDYRIALDAGDTPESLSAMTKVSFYTGLVDSSSRNTAIHLYIKGIRQEQLNNTDIKHTLLLRLFPNTRFVTIPEKPSGFNRDSTPSFIFSAYDRKHMSGKGIVPLLKKTHGELPVPDFIPAYDRPPYPEFTPKQEVIISGEQALILQKLLRDFETSNKDGSLARQIDAQKLVPSFHFASIQISDNGYYSTELTTDFPKLPENTWTLEDLHALVDRSLSKATSTEPLVIPSTQPANEADVPPSHPVQIEVKPADATPDPSDADQQPKVETQQAPPTVPVVLEASEELQVAKETIKPLEIQKGNTESASAAIETPLESFLEQLYAVFTAAPVELRPELLEMFLAKIGALPTADTQRQEITDLSPHEKAALKRYLSSEQFEELVASRQKK